MRCRTAGVESGLISGILLYPTGGVTGLDTASTTGSGLLFIMLCSPFYTNLLKIKQNGYSKSMILQFLEESTKNLLLILIYLCSLVNV